MDEKNISSKFTIPSASALIVCKGKILWVRSQTTRDKWAPPGGKVERKETPTEAAIREVKEEVGLEIKIDRKMRTYLYHTQNKEYEIDCFLASTKMTDLKLNSEIIIAKWCTPEESKNLKLTLTARQALEDFLKIKAVQ